MENLIVVSVVATNGQEYRSTVVAVVRATTDVVGMLAGIEDDCDTLIAQFDSKTGIKFIITATDDKGRPHQVVADNDDYLWYHVSNMLGWVLPE